MTMTTLPWDEWRVAWILCDKHFKQQRAHITRDDALLPRFHGGGCLPFPPTTFFTFSLSLSLSLSLYYSLIQLPLAHCTRSFVNKCNKCPLPGASLTCNFDSAASARSTSTSTSTSVPLLLIIELECPVRWWCPSLQSLRQFVRAMPLSHYPTT